uniref:Uncharacterized protein n=1 Tax=Salarias fasciatus TaxID=181472 RepID=A0A672IQH3_SALFA
FDLSFCHYSSVMKQESRLTNFQRKQISQNSKNRTDLPVTSPPPSKSVHRPRSYVSGKRSAASCRSGNSYSREKFRPGPTRDLEKEKRRLQDILSTGAEEPREAPPEPSPPEKKERYEEVLDEIEERRQFLSEMASLGQERDYVDIINAEISQQTDRQECQENTVTERVTHHRQHSATGKSFK